MAQNMLEQGFIMYESIVLKYWYKVLKAGYTVATSLVNNACDKL